MRFYRDVLGFKVAYDQIIRTRRGMPRDAAGDAPYPGYDGKGVIPVLVITLTDRDGYAIELNELLAENPRSGRSKSTAAK